MAIPRGFAPPRHDNALGQLQVSESFPLTLRSSLHIKALQLIVLALACLSSSCFAQVIDSIYDVSSSGPTYLLNWTTANVYGLNSLSASAIFGMRATNVHGDAGTEKATVAVVPEPTSVSRLLPGGAGLLYRRRRSEHPLCLPLIMPPSRILQPSALAPP